MFFLLGGSPVAYIETYDARAQRWVQPPRAGGPHTSLLLRTRFTRGDASTSSGASTGWPTTTASAASTRPPTLTGPPCPPCTTRDATSAWLHSMDSCTRAEGNYVTFSLTFFAHQNIKFEKLSNVYACGRQVTFSLTFICS